MGLDINGTQFLLYAKSLGVDFSQLAMIGRQELHLTPSELKSCLVKFGFSFEEQTIHNIFNKNGRYADEFLRCLGARDVHSFDYSAYEGATYLQDMNQAIPQKFMQKYSLVLDYGSLEHVFNFPVAIKNCMEMVRVGGYYLSATPANNFMGHGFYQFSPELFFSVFSPENGYQLINIIACEVDDDARWYSVKNTLLVKERVTLVNRKPVYLLVLAKRIDKVVPFASIPQQSDYISTWKNIGDDVQTGREIDMSMRNRNRLVAFALRYTPFRVKEIAKAVLGYNHNFNPKFFVPFEKTNRRKPSDKTQLALVCNED